MLLKLIETFVPEPFVFVHPFGYFTERLASKRDVHFPPLFPAFDESRPLEQLEVFCHCIEGRVERLRDVEKARRSVCQLPDNRPSGGMRQGGQHVR